VTVLAREDEVHLHALQTLTEQFQLCEWGILALGSCIVVQKYRLDHGMHLITQPAHIFPYSNSAMKGNNGTNNTILLPKPSQNLPYILQLETGIPDCRLPWVFSDVNSS
jgi:hypothetical protein